MARKKKKTGVGIIGCGNIAQAYFNGLKMFDTIKVVSCADINMAAARAKARENGCQAQTVKALLANKDIDIVVNLTIPAVHAEVSMDILKAGKHVHSEKPLAINLEDAKAILELADKKNLMVGCAPDTFLGAGLQTCRKIIDDNWIGRIVGGTAFMMGRGPEGWHPNPSFFYKKGAGPMFDMGPYYMTALVHLLGPAKKISAITSRARDERIITNDKQFGKMIEVEVPTHYAGVIEFHSGAVITVTISFDVKAHSHNPIELYGMEGSLKVPDPNTFGGPVELFTAANGEWNQQTLSHPYADNSRGIGVADMASAIHKKRKNRTSGELAYHVLEMMLAFEKASNTGRTVSIKSKPVQPAAFPIGMVPGKLDD